MQRYAQPGLEPLHDSQTMAEPLDRECIGAACSMRRAHAFSLSPFALRLGGSCQTQSNNSSIFGQRTPVAVGRVPVCGSEDHGSLLG